MTNTLLGFWLPHDGYGIMTAGIASALAKGNRDWQFVDIRPTAKVMGGYDRDKAKELHWDCDGPTVMVTAPEWLEYVTAPTKICFTMFESTRLLKQRVDALNAHAAACIVPCDWNAQVFKDSGVKIPVLVVPLGGNGENYPLITRRRDGSEPYTFFWSGTGDRRKGWDIVYQAFFKAGFGERKDARLILHFRNMPRGIRNCNDRNVVLYQGQINLAGVLKTMAQSDCYVYPSRGEGWGLTPREAACTGLPVITTDYGGLSEGINYWGYPLKVGALARADYGPWDDDLGEWAEPDLDHLVDQMRWCFENRSSAMYFGANAAAWLRQHQNWTITAQLLNQTVKQVQKKTAPFDAHPTSVLEAALTDLKTHLGHQTQNQ